MNGSGRIYSGKKAYNYRRKIKRPKKNEQTRAKISAVRLLVCGLILLLAVLFKILFPTTFSQASKYISQVIGRSIDYKAAAISLGEGISGKKTLSEAISEAYAYAFKAEYSEIAEDSQQAISDNTETAKQETQEEDETDSTASTVASLVYTAEIEAESSPAAITEAETISAMVTAYKEEQAAYSEAGVPDSVTYDRPEIAIAYTVPLIGTVSSGFGYRVHPVDGIVRFHYGTDIASDIGTDIVSFADGKVTAIGESTSYGLYILVEHQNGIETLYAHCSDVFVSSGDTITKGQKIGAVGESGNATGPCLHFEIRINDIYVNPEYYL